MSPPASAGLPPLERAGSWTRVAAGAGGLATALAAGMIIARIRRRPGTALEPYEREEAGMSEVEFPTPAATPAAPAVSVRALTKCYGEALAVEDVRFDVASGEAVALWGPNGAGKTTILHCLLGVARYTGELRVNGLDPQRDGRQARATIGFVPQELAPSPMPVGELASFIARLRGASEAEALEQLARLGIDDQIQKPVAALSGGMKQRLALALALVGSPGVLLLDEPTANLDAAGRAGLLSLLRELKRDGITLIFSSHRPDDVLALADRILTMDRGRLTCSLTPDEFAGLLDASARLVLTLSNGYVAEAAATLDRLGYTVATSGQVLTVQARGGERARVLNALLRSGIEFDDIDLEAGA
jgi:ABC-type multidrug transport system ATPase subunit